MFFCVGAHLQQLWMFLLCSEFPRGGKFCSFLGLSGKFQFVVSFFLVYISLSKVYTGGYHFCSCSCDICGVHQDLLPHAPPHQDHPYHSHLVQSQEYIQKLFWLILHKKHKRSFEEFSSFLCLSTS